MPYDRSDDSTVEDKNRWCPSCRLSVSQETGRVKWCSDVTSGGWRQKKFLLMVLLPLASLPITLLLIAVAQHRASNQAANTRLPVSTHTHNIQVPFVYDPELAELEDRELMQDVKTEFVPTASLGVFLRRKRDAGSTWYTDQANDTSEEDIVWEVPQRPGVAHKGGSRNHLDPGAATAAAHNNTAAGETRGNLTGTDSSKEFPDVMSPRPELLEASGNILSDNYPNVEAEASLDTVDIHESDAEDVVAATAGELSEDLPWRTVVHEEALEAEDTDQAAGQDEEEDTRGDVSYDRGAGNYDQGIGEDGDREQESEFQMFWKGEGDMTTIRKAQAKMMLEYMDLNADPCVDFYDYACGNWGHKNPIPKDKSAYDTFEMLRESLDSVLRDLLEEPIVVQEGHTLEELWRTDAIVKAKNLFHSCMDHEILERRSVQPLMSLLKELGGWPILEPNWDATNFDWLLLTAKLRLFNNDILISEWVGPDIKNSDEYIIQFDQTSLGLPSREYFLQETNLIYLEAYKNYLIMVTTLLGASLDAAMTNADDLIEFETKLAQITSSQEDRRNVSELYQRMWLSDLKDLVPQIDWVRYLSLVLARPVASTEPVVVFAVKYIQDLVVLLDDTEPKTIANYLLWRFVRHRVNNLDDRFQAAKQRFYYILFGREQAPLRWKNCVAQVNGNMGMAVGAMFVRKYFDENSKNDTLYMTEEIMESFRELLFYTNWIDIETKFLATLKVDAMMLRIGYPDFILNLDLLNEWYKDVLISPFEYFENTLHILQHLTRFEQDRLGTAVNKTLWSTAPAVVNAYYSRNKNQIMFPAGILQPPFYHRYFPRSLNYGGIGVVIGHEITHGFDDKGRLFDKNGNLHRWWHDDAIERFHQRAQCLIDQYSQYTVDEVSMQVDGVNTQGENIADNGGIKQAFRAYQRWVAAHQNEDDSLPGLELSGNQLFFLNFAQIWCGTMRPEATRNKLKTAVHSPGKFRVIGTLSNSEDFARVFSCPPGSPMNPSDKCSVW